MKKIEEAIKHVGGLSKFSAALGIKSPSVTHWRSGKQKVPIKRCVQIEKVTNGAVTRKDLRPDDWWEIWPELEDRKETK